MLSHRIGADDDPMSRERPSGVLLPSVLASAAGGLTARVVMHPVDSIRVLRQTAPRGLERAKVSWAQLYRGLGVACVFQVPALTAYLTTYDAAKQRLAAGTGLGVSSISVHLGSALLAELASAVLWTPMEVVKQRLQALKGTSARGLFASIVKQEGLRGMFRGYFVTLAVFVPHSMAYFATYEQLKQKSAATLGTSELPTWAFVASSAAAGAVASVVTNPLDVVKTQWQVGGHTGFGLAEPRTPADVVLRLWRTEGLRAFSRGMAARVLLVAPSVAISMSIYEETKRSLQRLWHVDDAA